MATTSTVWAITVSDTEPDSKAEDYVAYVCNDGQCAEDVAHDARSDPLGATTWSKPHKIDLAKVPEGVTGCWSCGRAFVDEDAD